jgi:deoxycytidine triphosphate deaminase
VPRLITGDELRSAVKQETFIQGGDEACVEGVKYDFRMSSHILKAEFKRPVDASKLSEREQSDLVVQPGEMVFVLSQERLVLPSNIMAQLSPKRRLSHAGILAIGGFCIDPKYEGRLLVGLFNFSSTPFILRPGKKLIAATFQELQDSECGDFEAPTRVEDFPDELVGVMEKYRPVLMQALEADVQRLRRDLDGLQEEFHSRDEWYKQLREALDRHDGQIALLIKGLQQENEARTKGEDKIGKALGKIQDMLTWLKAAAWIGGILAGAIGLPVIVMWIAKQLGLTD